MGNVKGSSSLWPPFVTQFTEHPSSGFSIFISFVFFSKFSKVILQTFYYILCFCFHLLKQPKRKSIFQFVVYKYFPLSSLFFFFVDFRDLFCYFFASFFPRCKKYFCCQKRKNSITGKGTFSVFLPLSRSLTHSPIMDDFPIIKKPEGRKEKLFPRKEWKFFLRNRE